MAELARMYGWTHREMSAEEYPVLVRYWREGRRLQAEERLFAVDAACAPHWGNRDRRAFYGALIEASRTPTVRAAAERREIESGWAALRKAGKRKA